MAGTVAAVESDCRRIWKAGLRACLASLLLLATTVAAEAGIETRATVLSDFVTAHRIEPVERTYAAGTELEHRATLKEAFLVADPETLAAPHLLALPKEADGRIAARFAEGRVRIETELQMSVERAYRIFRRDSVYTVQGRDGDALLVRSHAASDQTIVRVPADKFRTERVLVSDDGNGSAAATDSPGESEDAYAGELQAYLAAHPPPGEPEKAEDLEDVVCVIEEGESAGTGFLIVMDGRVYCLTNHHVLGSAQGLSIRTSEGRSFTPLFYEVARDRDLARILIAEFPPALTELDEAAYGDRVRVVGNRGGLGVVRLEKAEVIGFAPGIIELDQDFAPGNSGSPVIRDDGCVVGVATYLISARDADLGEEEIKDGEILFEDRYFATRLEADIEWIPVSPDALAQMDRNLFADDIFTADAFSLLRMVARNPYTPIVENLSASAELRLWVGRLNSILRRNREAVQNPGRQFLDYNDYQTWQIEQSAVLLNDMRGLLRRLEYLSRSRLSRLKTRRISYPEIGYYPSMTEELVRRYELLIEVSRVVVDALSESGRQGNG